MDIVMQMLKEYFTNLKMRRSFQKALSLVFYNSSWLCIQTTKLLLFKQAIRFLISFIVCPVLVDWAITIKQRILDVFGKTKVLK